MRARVLLVVACGCAASSSVNKSDQDIPEWFGAECGGALVCGEGSSDLPDLQMAKDAAENVARGHMATKVQARASALVKDWAEGIQRKVGKGESKALVESHAEAVRRTVVDQVLTGIRQDKFHRTEDGTLFVRLSIGADSIQQSAKVITAEEERRIRQKTEQGYEELRQALGEGGQARP